MCVHRFRPSIGPPGSRNPLDRIPSGRHRSADDGGLSQPEFRRPLGSRAADARGLRAGREPTHAHREGTQASGHLRPAQRGVLSRGGAEAPGQQTDGPESLS